MPFSHFDYPEDKAERYEIFLAQAASLLDYGFANCTGFEDQTTALKLPAIPVKAAQAIPVLSAASLP